MNMLLVNDYVKDDLLKSVNHSRSGFALILALASALVLASTIALALELALVLALALVLVVFVSKLGFALLCVASRHQQHVLVPPGFVCSAFGSAWFRMNVPGYTSALQIADVFGSCYTFALQIANVFGFDTPALQIADVFGFGYTSALQIADVFVAGTPFCFSD
ncbi:hypothetical protein Tco_1330341 [Tanacetum coccineum]